jgi:hypothetical protein
VGCAENREADGAGAGEGIALGSRMGLVCDPSVPPDSSRQHDMFDEIRSQNKAKDLFFGPVTELIIAKMIKAFILKNREHQSQCERTPAAVSPIGQSCLDLVHVTQIVKFG